jgi:hypothetical protein
MNDLFSNLRRNITGCWVNGVYMGIFGYSDDNLLIAPSLDSLQEMVKTCESYASEQNLKFSTNVDPVKCKTKCIAFLRKKKDVGDVELGGVHLPWVIGGLHIGNTLRNRLNGMKQDIKVKRAKFINKNIDLNQEFNFCHPSTKVKMNLIYKFDFTGSPVWDLFSSDAIMLKNSWNTSVRIMYDLPLQTHRIFIEPVSKCKHLKRFLSFLNLIENSKKLVPKQMLNYRFQPSKPPTLTDKNSIDELCKDDIRKLKYHQMDCKDTWKEKMINEITDVKFNKLEVENFSHHRC